MRKLSPFSFALGLGLMSLWPETPVIGSGYCIGPGRPSVEVMHRRVAKQLRRENIRDDVRAARDGLPPYFKEGRCRPEGDARLPKMTRQQRRWLARKVAG